MLRNIRSLLHCSYLLHNVRSTLCNKYFSFVAPLQGWLERTPGLEENGFSFWKRYREASEKMLLEMEKKIEVCSVTLSISWLVDGMLSKSVDRLELGTVPQLRMC